MQLRKKKRFFTIMIIPHTEESIVSIRIPLYLFQSLGIILLISLLVAFFWIKSYQQLKGEATAVPQLREDNRTLNEQIDLLARETEELIRKVNQMDDLSREICNLLELPLPKKMSNSDPIRLVHNENARVLSSRGENQVMERTSLNISHLQVSIPDQSEKLLQLKEDIVQHQKQMASTPSIWPVRGRVTSEFGPRISPITRRREFHFGIDIAGSRGSPIYAAADGKVIFAAYRRGFGNTVILNHGDSLSTLYAHLKSFNVSVGSEVKKGQVLGYMGSTGYSTGAHVHYEVHKKGVAVNPGGYLP